MKGIYLEPGRVAAIDALYAQRSELALNIEENRDAILQIDARLEALGVEEISSEELATKFGENLASPMASYPATNSSTKWTSLRTIYVYQGRQYEVQRVTGVPNIPEETTGIVDHENYTLTSIGHL